MDIWQRPLSANAIRNQRIILHAILHTGKLNLVPFHSLWWTGLLHWATQQSIRQCIGCQHKPAMRGWTIPDRTEQLFLTDSHSAYFQIWEDLKMLLPTLSTSFVPKQTDSRCLSPPQQHFLPFPTSPNGKPQSTGRPCTAGPCRAPEQPIPGAARAGQGMALSPLPVLPQPVPVTAPTAHPGAAPFTGDIPHPPKAVIWESQAA